MILTILKYLLYAGLGYLLYIELQVIFQMYRRYKQGLDIVYFPVLGFVYFQIFKKNSTKDNARWFKERVRLNEVKNKKAFAMNFPTFSQPLVLIQDPDMINEVLTREMDICVRKDIKGGLKLYDVGNFYDYSERALTARGAFTEIFRAENMNSMAPKIQKVVDGVLDSMESDAGFNKKLETEEFVDINLEPVIIKIFFQILDKILFGADSDTLVDGKPLTHQINMATEEIHDVLNHPKHYVTFGLLVTNRLDPAVRKLDQLMAKIKGKIMELYNKMKDDPDVPANNFLGGVIHYNRKNPEEPLDEREITGNIFLMVFAAYDTSRHSTGWAMRFLSIYHNDQNALRAEAEKIGTLAGELDGEKLEAGPELNAWMKELLRLGSPFSFSEVREFTKNAKIKGISFKKGDMISLVMLYNQFKEKDFPDAYRFDRTRHYKGNSKYHRNNLMPFGGGKRGCIGKYLAIMNIKIIVLSVLRRYSLDADPGFEPENDHLPFHNLEEVMVRLRKL